MTAAAKNLLVHAPGDPIATEDTPRLFKRIGRAFREGRLNVDDLPSFRGAGVSNEEVAAAFEIVASTSGKVLNRLAQVWREIERLEPQAASRIREIAKRPPTVWERLGSIQRGFGNLWRASLVAQLGTAQRNLENYAG